MTMGLGCCCCFFFFFFIALSFVASTKAQSGYFWHVTDFHLDVNYTVGGNAAGMCWPQGENPLPSNEVASTPVGKWGNYRCDSPYALVVSAVNAMKQYGSKPDFILWTGDDKAHVGDSFFSDDKVINLIKNLTDTLTKAFPRTPLIPVLGNHDWFPTHQLPANPNVLYDRIGEHWKNWIDLSTFRTGGFYSKVINPGIEFVVLNTALYYNKNSKVPDSLEDPAGQFEWLEKKLRQAKTSGRKVYITSHVPPGVFERHMIKGGFQWLKPRYNKRLVQIISNYGDAINGQFFAHHHTDSFRIFYDQQGQPSSWLLIAPAVTPWNTTLSHVGPNNPGLRKFYYNKKNGEVTTFDQYFLNLSEANANNNAAWKLEYRAHDAFKLDGSITAHALHRVAQSFNNGDSTLFNRYYLHNSVSYQSAAECSSECRHYHYCAITQVDYSRFEKCRSPSSAEVVASTTDRLIVTDQLLTTDRLIAADQLITTDRPSSGNCLRSLWSMVVVVLLLLLLS